jgi:hypothetical protein
MKYELKDWLNSINHQKNNILDDDPDSIKQYPPYIINLCLSGFIDTVMFANEMNINSHLDSKLQYTYYLNSIRKKKRFSPWLKKDKINDLELIKQYYGYSNEKAKSALSLLNKDQINYIRKRLDIGGKK